MLKRLILFCFLITAVFTANANVFVVTSNADAGAGTLREALTLAAANGSAVKDYINFNIADQSMAGRTISILTELPPLSSNLVIDGSTQPGSKIGISDTKIKLQKSTLANATYNGFRGNNISDFELYGIYFTNLAEFGSARAVNIWDSSNILIGNPGKGNAFGFTDDGIFILRTNHIKVSSNFFGLDQETLLPAYAAYKSSFQILASKDIILGGDTRAEGNNLGGGGSGRISYIDGFDSNTGGILPIDNCMVKNNTFGFKTINGSVTDQIEFRNIKHLTADNNIFNYGIVVHFSDISDMLLIRGNKTNFNINLQPDLQSTSNIPFYLYNVVNAVIGGPNPEDANTINNNVYANSNYPSVYADGCSNIRLQRNSFSCKTTAESYSANNPKVTLPTISITSVTNGLIKGKATPGAEVEIFSDSQCQLCEPSHYLTSVTAAADGSWQYLTNNQSIGYTASASLNGRTSMFVKVGYDDSNVILSNPSCGNSNGSIKGIALVNSTRVEWKNTNGDIVGSTIDINGLAPGKYSFTAYLSENCSITSQVYTLVDTKPIIIDTYKNVIPNACSNSSGAILGLYIENSNVVNIQSITWTDQNQQIAGTDLNLQNVNSGSYILKVTTTDNCSTTYGPVIITNTVGPNLNQSNPIKNPSSCTIANGSIHGITATGTNVKFSWKNEQNVEVGTLADLDNQPAGKYTLTITDDSNCGPVTSLPIEILSANDITINSALKNVNDASCGITNGAITNIQVTGTGTYLWTNEQGVDVGHDKDLTDVSAGKYRLTVSSANCPPVSTEVIEIFEVNGITIDDTQKIISKATCQYDNGGISNIQVTGATKYTWYNAGNNAVSNNLDLTGMPTGNYYLIAANNNGCSKQTAVYTITRQPPVSYGGLTKNLKNASCDENNGSIEVIFQNSPVTLPDSYKWINTSTGQVVNTSTPILNGIDAGGYDIYAVTNGCEQFLISYFIARIPKPIIGTNNVQVTDDHCSAGTGSIKGIQVSGFAPISYTWTDDNGVNQGVSSTDLLYVKAGTYHLKITDGANCEQYLVYTIYDQADNIAPPTVNDVQLCSPGSALLSVNNTDNKYGYRLYEDNSSATPIDVQQNGRFKINVNTDRSYYVSQYLGNCESTRQEVKILISGISGTDIANTFTPNGDGINDYWKITGIENNINSVVKVFSRDGKMVYQSKGYAVPFDGTLDGKPLPVGIYYYIIDLKGCNLLSGNLTILR